MATKQTRRPRKKETRPRRPRRTTPIPREPPPIPFELDGTITNPKKRAFLIAFAGEGNIARASQAVKISRSTHYKWLKEDPAYAEIYLQAEQHAGDALELIARLRAIHGSDTLLIFLLKGIKPERYRERHELSGPGGGPVVPAVVHVSYHKDMEPPPEADTPPELREKK